MVVYTPSPRRRVMEQIFEKDEFELPENDSSRNQMQRIALFAIYDILTYLDMKEPVDVQSIVSGLTDVDYENADYFVKVAAVYTVKYLSDIIPVFNAHMNKWTFDRLNRVEQAILLLSYIHYFHIEEVDKGVVIDIAVRLAKVYLDAKDYRFVNAVLDKVLVK